MKPYFYMRHNKLALGLCLSFVSVLVCLVFSEISLNVPLGLKLDTPPLRTEGGREIYWRIKAERTGVYKLVFKRTIIKLRGSCL